MSKVPTTNYVRIIPRDSDYLGRKLGAKGEIFVDQDNTTIRIYDGQTYGGISLARNDLLNVSNATFLAKANSSLTTYALKTYVDDSIAAIPAADLTGYATETFVTEDRKSVV